MKFFSNVIFKQNGERGIRTLAPVARPTPLAGAPLQPLEYFSSESYYIKPFYVCQLLFRIFLIFSLLAYNYIIYAYFLYSKDLKTTVNRTLYSFFHYGCYFCCFHIFILIIVYGFQKMYLHYKFFDRSRIKRFIRINQCYGYDRTF